jgi:hypothetical protein
MSTFDPGLEPPGDWQQSYYDPQPYAPNEAAGRAAVYQWVSAGVQLAMSCCCGLSAIGLMMIGTDELLRQMPPDMPNREMVNQMLPILGPVIAVASVVLLLIPALVLGVLAFKIRSGGRGAIIASLVILGIQTLGLGVLTLMNLIGAVFNRSLGDLVGVMILAGAVLIFAGTLVQLSMAIKQSYAAPPTDQGW